MQCIKTIKLDNGQLRHYNKFSITTSLTGQIKYFFKAPNLYGVFLSLEILYHLHDGERSCGKQTSLFYDSYCQRQNW